MKYPKILPEVSVILFDIDGTLTYRRDRYPSNSLLGRPSSSSLADGTQMFPDAPGVIRTLPEAGYELYTATTNAASIARQKLALGGFNNGGCAAYFKGVMGGEEISPGGKTSARFFGNLLRYYGLDAAKVLHVGDDPVLDVLCPLEAGIPNVVQIKRSQEEPVVPLASGGLAINDLSLLPELLGIDVGATR